MARDLDFALSEAKRMVDIITKPTSEVSEEIRNQIASDTVDNFAEYYNKGFLNYFTSVTQAVGPAVTEWMGQGSKLQDVFGRYVITAGTLINAEAVRIEPALNIPYDILDEALNRLEDTLKSIS